MQVVTDFTAIISDDVWRNGFGDQRFVITYGFAEALPDHQGDVRDAAFRNSFSAYDEAAKQSARDAFQMWEDASALRFIEVDAADADMVFGLFDFDASAATQFIDGFAFFPGESKIAGDVFINETSSTSLTLHLHEIGHALGLEHPFEGDLVLPDELDNRSVTVMSSTGSSVDGLRDFDVQAIQFMYGLPEDTPPAEIPSVGYSNAFTTSRSFFSSIRDLTYGDTGTVTVTVRNFGEDPFGSGLDVVLVLSKDEELGFDDFVIGSTRIGDLGPNEEISGVEINFEIFDSVPASLTEDDYFVLVALDPTNEVAETRETDNITTIAMTTVSGATGDNPGDAPPPFLVDPRTGERAPSDPPVDPPREEPPSEDPPAEDPPVEEPEDPPVEEPADPPMEEPSDPPVVDPPAPDPIDPPADDPMDPPAEEPADPPTPDPEDPDAGDPGPTDPNAPTAGDDAIAGSAAADVLDGLGGADLLTGLGGSDTLNGGGGADTLIGNGGRDQLSGGGGRDDLQGGGGADTLLGNGGRDVLNGNGGRDDLQGGGGRDLLIGGGGRDRLDGGGGADTMQGGGGRDEIIGGRGSDVLTGDGGADRFIFDRGNGRDTITDFQQGRDKIVIAGGADSFDALGITQQGDDVMIRISNTRVLVEDDLVENFTDADFIF